HIGGVLWATSGPARREAAVAQQALGDRIRASGLGRHGNPPFTAPNPAGHKAPSRRPPADCCRRIRKWACAEVKSALGVVRPALGPVRGAGTRGGRWRGCPGPTPPPWAVASPRYAVDRAAPLRRPWRP